MRLQRGSFVLLSPGLMKWIGQWWDRHSPSAMSSGPNGCLPGQTGMSAPPATLEKLDTIDRAPG